MEEFLSEQPFQFGIPEPRLSNYTEQAQQLKCEASSIVNVNLHSHTGGTKTSSKQERKKLAGLKSREKKKRYVEQLEENVKILNEQVQILDSQISKCKDNLLEALRTANNASNNEHAYTFSELERNICAEYPDFDRIALLVDLIRNRIGANGIQRKANLDYNFKQIVNFMFPAAYRYLLNTAQQELDIFSPQCTADSLVVDNNCWITDAFKKISLNQQQIDKIKQLKEQFRERRKDAYGHMLRLKTAKEDIKQQGQIFQRQLTIMSYDMTPMQCGLMTIFAQKNKLRKEFTFSGDFEESIIPTKRVKLE